MNIETMQAEINNLNLLIIALNAFTTTTIKKTEKIISSLQNQLQYMEQNGTEWNKTEQNGTEWNKRFIVPFPRTTNL